MTMARISSAELRANLSEALRSVDGGDPILITRNGKPAAALIAADQLPRLKSAPPVPPAEGAPTAEHDAGPGPSPEHREPTPEELLERAVAPTLRRINWDFERLPPELQAVMELIRENLFQPRLTVERIKRMLGVGANDVTSHFRKVTGAPIGRYLDDRRLECSCRLLVDTELDVQTIARLVGHRHKEVFARAFKRRFGVRPLVYRETGGGLSRDVAGVAQPSRAPTPPRYLAGLSAVGVGVSCANCDEILEPEVMMRVFEDLAPICDDCAWERAPDLVDALEKREIS